MRTSRAKFVLDATLAGLSLTGVAQGGTNGMQIKLDTPAFPDGLNIHGTTAIEVTANPKPQAVEITIDGGNKVTLTQPTSDNRYDWQWDTTRFSDGTHQIDARARYKTRGSTAHIAVTVNNTVPVPPPTPDPGDSRYAPPTLTNPVTITLTKTAQNPTLDNSKDYIIRGSGVLDAVGGVTIAGGHNVVVYGLEIAPSQADTSGSCYDHTGLKIKGGTNVHVEGCFLHGNLCDAIVVAAMNTNVTLQTNRVERAKMIAGGHPDVVQIQGGVKTLRVDRLTGYLDPSGSDQHGLLLKAENNGTLTVGKTDLSRIDIHGAFHAFWQETIAVGPITVEEFYIVNSLREFGIDVWPQKDAYGQSDPQRKAIVAADGASLTFHDAVSPGKNSNITGTIRKGAPPNGDFVAAAAVGGFYPLA